MIEITNLQEESGSPNDQYELAVVKEAGELDQPPSEGIIDPPSKRSTKACTQPEQATKNQHERAGCTGVVHTYSPILGTSHVAFWEQKDIMACKQPVECLIAYNGIKSVTVMLETR